jgi:hypothetical protein
MHKKILYENKWINLVKLNDWYVCTDEVRTDNNNFVCVLPYATIKGRRLEYLLRMEKNPAHHPTKPLISAITGQCETGIVRYHAQMELKEEGGYSVPASRLIYLGDCNPFKSSMAKMHLFVAPIYKTDVPHKAEGDGTFGEQGSYPLWVEKICLLACKDPYIQTTLVRLEDWLYNKEHRAYYKELEAKNLEG